MACDAASNYSIMLFFPRGPLPTMHRVNGVHSALSWLIALSSLYIQHMSRWLIWSHSCPWALSEVEIHFIPLWGCVAHAAVEGGGLEVVLPGHGFISWTWRGGEGLPQDLSRGITHDSSFPSSSKLYPLWFGRKVGNHDTSATCQVRN